MPAAHLQAGLCQPQVWHVCRTCNECLPSQAGRGCTAALGPASMQAVQAVPGFRTDASCSHHEDIMSTTLTTCKCPTQLEFRAPQTISFWGSSDAAHRHDGVSAELPVQPLIGGANTHQTAPSPTHLVSAAAPALLLRPLSPGCCPAVDQQSSTITSGKAAALWQASCWVNARADEAPPAAHRRRSS